VVLHLNNMSEKQKAADLGRLPPISEICGTSTICRAGISTPLLTPSPAAGSM